MENKYKIIYIHFLLFYFYKFKINIQRWKLMKNFENNRNGKQDSNNLINIKKVVYTVLLGKYDKINPIKKEKGFDYYLITDQYKKKNNYLNWTILHIPKTT